MKQFEYKVEVISIYKLESTLEYLGRNGWELVTSSIKESEKEGFEKIQLIFKKEK
jgi:hypothetical protein|tara:strand:+ start:239 stop:403 length:165 start_codon:yes stop_codon:yes gene_type:complete